MRVLLDENVPHDLIAAFTGHEVLTVQGLVVLVTRSSKVVDVMPLVPEALAALKALKAGQIVRVGA